ncbi:MAG: M48 family metalloprotease [Gemmatimonadetes bacterium]|nr:M48 family metalloprotease [Gemmatimonadota bacterium]
MRRTRRLALLPPAVVLVLAAGCLATQQQEVQMGAGYAAEINSKLPIVRDPEISAYVNRLGDSLARLADSRGLEWHFYVVDAKEVNAFAVPGGYIYVNRGLIERFTKMDQLAGVLGHEIGHVTQRHTIKQQQKATGASLGITLGCVLTGACNNPAVGSLVNVGAGAMMAGFSRDDEAEADRVGLDYVVRAGIDPRGMPETFEILMAERKAKPEGVASFFRTHPLEEDRIREARALIAKVPADRLVGLTEDSRAFQQFKARVKALPPSPASPSP